MDDTPPDHGAPVSWATGVNRKLAYADFLGEAPPRMLGQAPIYNTRVECAAPPTSRSCADDLPGTCVGVPERQPPEQVGQGRRGLCEFERRRLARLLRAGTPH